MKRTKDRHDGNLGLSQPDPPGQEKLKRDSRIGSTFFLVGHLDRLYDMPLLDSQQTLNVYHSEVEGTGRPVGIWCSRITTPPFDYEEKEKSVMSDTPVQGPRKKRKEYD